MSQQLLAPKYLTEEIAKGAVTTALYVVMDKGAPLRSDLRRHQCHIVILVPAMQDARSDDYPDWPNYPLQPVSLYEQSVGNKNEWEHAYDNIARCKALQLWTDRNDDRAGVIPHLLFPGDTPFWGGVKRHGIVVACSGVQPWFDKLISGIVADTLIALAHNSYENNDRDGDFLD